ncbi:MAG: MFS transporter [Burkholderiales bacterium]
MIASRFSARRVYFLGIALFTLTPAACGLSDALWKLITTRVVQGAAGGLMMTVGRTLALRDAPKSQLMSITSLLVWPALLAPVLGPPPGGWITTYASWRWDFLLNLPLGLLGLLCVARFVPPDPPGLKVPLDWRGALLTVGGLGTLFVGLELTAHASGESAMWALAAMLMGVGATMLLLAANHLLHAAHPLLSLAPLRVQTFAVSTFAAGIHSSMCLQATPYLLPLLFQLGFGSTAAEAGARLLPYFLGNLLTKSATRPLLRRFGFKTVLIADGTFAMLLIAALGLVDAQTPWSWSTVLLFVAGAARSMLLTALNTLVLCRHLTCRSPSRSDAIFGVLVAWPDARRCGGYIDARSGEGGGRSADAGASRLPDCLQRDQRDRASAGASLCGGGARFGRRSQWLGAARLRWCLEVKPRGMARAR